MKLIILTTCRQAIASRCLPRLCANPNLQVTRVIVAQGGSPHKLRAWRRRVRKTWRIGLLGALNGVRLRSWYLDQEAADIAEVCRALNVELVETPFINCERTKELFREVSPDLGLSLGNSYIGKSVYSLPRFGMVNVHTEVLPRFQGAQSIIWPLYEGVQETGFTIHQLDAHIDTGAILYQQRFPIRLYPTLQETVTRNLQTAWEQMPAAFAYVCEHYEDLRQQAVPQERGPGYTTPTFAQYRQMVRNHRQMWQATAALKQLA